MMWIGACRWRPFRFASEGLRSNAETQRRSADVLKSLRPSIHGYDTIQLLPQVDSLDCDEGFTVTDALTNERVPVHVHGPSLHSTTHPQDLLWIPENRHHQRLTERRGQIRLLNTKNKEIQDNSGETALYEIIERYSRTPPRITD